MEVDVVGKKIRFARNQILRRRKVGVGGQRPGVLVFDDSDQGIQKRLHPLRPVPAHQIGRNFVVDVVPQDGRMAGVRLGGPPHASPDLPTNRPVVQKQNPPLPRHRHHHPQAVFRRLIQKPAGRRMVDTHGVEARRRDQPEIPGGLGGGAKMVLPLPERAVGHALQEKFGVSGKEKLTPRRHAGSAQGRRPDFRLRSRLVRKKRNGGGVHSRS